MLLEFGVDIVECGMMLMGGGVLLCDFDCLFVEEIGLLVFVVEDLLICVVCGLGMVFECMDKLGSIFLYE